MSATVSRSSSRQNRGLQRDIAYEALRNALIVQEIPAGTKLSEPEWVTRLNVSRTAIREAFARLEAEHLIARGPKAGYIVPALTDDDIEEIREVRFALEAAAIERICLRKSLKKSDFKQLEDTTRQQAELFERGFQLGVVEADRHFHQQLVDLAGSRRLARLYRCAPLPITHRPTVLSVRAASQRTLDEHRHIIAALQAWDAAKARSLLRAHLFAPTPPAADAPSPA